MGYCISDLGLQKSYVQTFRRKIHRDTVCVYSMYMRNFLLLPRSSNGGGGGMLIPLTTPADKYIFRKAILD